MRLKEWMPPLGFGLLVMTAAAGAQDSVSEGANRPDAERPLEEVLVTAHPLSGEGLAQASDVLVGEELARKLDTNIGATLAQQPGIRSASFGKAVGRPVIHGLGGPRVRIMEDRIDALDVSVTSTDHAVTIEPFVAERIEVLKGSAALLYGSGAIGGVVDIHTGRIPHEVPEAAISGGIETRFDTNTNGNATSIKLNGGRGKLAWHLDGTQKDGDDYDIPGFSISAAQQALDLAGGLGTGGTLPGSAFNFTTFAGGVSYVEDWGFVGASVSRLEADYGLPGGVIEDPTEIGTPTLDVEQTRTDFELGITNPFGFFSSLNVRLGVNDYTHQELEPDGAVATTFDNEAWELRTELVYETDSWSGAFGVQHTQRDFSALGEEAFVPPVESSDTGLFWVTERPFARFDLEGGLRIGRVEHEPDVADDESFTVYAASLGAVVPFSEVLQLSVIADYSSRAPIAEELFSNGPHLASRAFELGDAGLDNERAVNLSAQLSADAPLWNATATVYYTRFRDFIFEQATGAIIEGLTEFQFTQDDARFVGVDAEASAQLVAWEGGDLWLRVLFDTVDAELDGGGNNNLPRIPSLRYGAGVEAKWGVVSASVDYVRTTRQSEVAEVELVTSGYDDLRAYLGAEFRVGEVTLATFVSGKNLTDTEQRAHTSFIKDFAPAPGRTIEAGLRVLF